MEPQSKVPTHKAPSNIPADAPDTGRPKDSKKVRVRSCSEYIKVPDDVDDVLPPHAGYATFKCHLKHGHIGNHSTGGYVFRKNGTAQHYTILFHELGRAEARSHS